MLKGLNILCLLITNKVFHSNSAILAHIDYGNMVLCNFIESLYIF